MSDGSSPRVRGTLDSLDFVESRTVHPRVCGERVDDLPRTGDVRFIPACAGNAGELPQYRMSRFIPACAGNAWRRSSSD